VLGQGQLLSEQNASPWNGGAFHQEFLLFLGKLERSGRANGLLHVKRPARRFLAHRTLIEPFPGVESFSCCRLVQAVAMRVKGSFQLAHADATLLCESRQRIALELTREAIVSSARRHNRIWPQVSSTHVPLGMCGMGFSQFRKQLVKVE